MISERPWLKDASLILGQRLCQKGFYAKTSAKHDKLADGKVIRKLYRKQIDYNKNKQKHALCASENTLPLCYLVFRPTRPQRTSLLNRVLEQAQHAPYQPIPRSFSCLKPMYHIARAKTIKTIFSILTTEKMQSVWTYLHTHKV